MRRSYAALFLLLCLSPFLRKACLRSFLCQFCLVCFLRKTCLLSFPFLSFPDALLLNQAVGFRGFFCMISINLRLELCSGIG